MPRKLPATFRRSKRERRNPLSFFCFILHFLAGRLRLRRPEFRLFIHFTQFQIQFFVQFAILHFPSIHDKMFVSGGEAHDFHPNRNFGSVGYELVRPPLSIKHRRIKKSRGLREKPLDKYLCLWYNTNTRGEENGCRL